MHPPFDGVTFCKRWKALVVIRVVVPPCTFLRLCAQAGTIQVASRLSVPAADTRRRQHASSGIIERRRLQVPSHAERPIITTIFQTATANGSKPSQSSSDPRRHVLTQRGHRELPQNRRFRRHCSVATALRSRGYSLTAAPCVDRVGDSVLSRSQGSRL